MAGKLPLRGRLAVVTGAARGIGAATARHLVHRGARVALIGLEPDELHRTASSLDGDAHSWAVDVTDDKAMADVADRVRRRMGRPSVVVANAGVASTGPLLDSDARVWRRVIDVNLVGSGVTARSFLPDLIATRGYFLQVSSLAAFGPSPMMTAYCASKSGAESFAQALRAEVVHHGVGVGVAYLGWTDTEMIRSGEQYAALREVRRSMPGPAGRIHSPEVVAGRLVRGVEHRSPAVYSPPWIRAMQVVRGAVPGVVVRASSRKLRRRTAEGDYAATGLLGAGGRADAARCSSD